MQISLKDLTPKQTDEFQRLAATGQPLGLSAVQAALSAAGSDEQFTEDFAQARQWRDAQLAARGITAEPVTTAPPAQATVPAGSEAFADDFRHAREWRDAQLKEKGIDPAVG